ncbi:hypothetical protein PV05_02015 [Exophiala xenobiotica]|uniref:Uncharacterized protein n=1 Tax=Exophiala xenobiotica TaxID=348802 RepID=A0A0D2F4R5_9EURO|nr:uncharacterized protein PV05_02015 [Exophiala xenobiotica]KIW61955.1 hypothetical protein PV05_02015 [Exophiala xenobiotica]
MGFLGDKYKSFTNFKNGRNADGSSKISDEDLQKYTGMDRAELDKFAANTPGVGANQNAGSITAGGNNGLYNGAYTTRHRVSYEALTTDLALLGVPGARNL